MALRRSESNLNHFEAIDSAGRLLATYIMSGVSPADPEEIQVGPGTRAETSYVYLGDIGANNFGGASLFRVSPFPAGGRHATRAVTARRLDGTRH
jgi:hypothetical protein